jgi:hypothetical protein
MYHIMLTTLQLSTENRFKIWTKNLSRLIITNLTKMQSILTNCLVDNPQCEMNLLRQINLRTKYRMATSRKRAIKLQKNGRFAIIQLTQLYFVQFYGKYICYDLTGRVQQQFRLSMTYGGLETHSMLVTIKTDACHSHDAVTLRTENQETVCSELSQ